MPFDVPFVAATKGAAGEWGSERIVTSQVSREFLGWDRPASEGPWLHTGENLRASHSKVEASLFREICTHSSGRMQSLSEGESSAGVWSFSFSGLGNFIG